MLTSSPDSWDECWAHFIQRYDSTQYKKHISQIILLATFVLYIHNILKLLKDYIYFLGNVMCVAICVFFTYVNLDGSQKRASDSMEL